MKLTEDHKAEEYFEIEDCLEMGAHEFKAGGSEEEKSPSDDSSDNSDDIDAEISALEEGSSEEDAPEDEETDEDDGTGVDNPNFSPMPRKKVNRTDAGRLQ